MGRLLAFLLGGLALALYLPPVFLDEVNLGKYTDWWKSFLTEVWYTKVFLHGPGIFAGLALLLLAIRGREGGGYPPH
jgi:hypothetical protein